MQGTLKTLFVEVILPLPLEKLYTYRVPQELNDIVLPGKRVAVHFRGQKVYAAIIRNIRTKPPEGYQASYVLQVIDEHPIVTEQEFEAWEWVAKYYLSPIGDVMNVSLPAGLKLKNEASIFASYEVIPPNIPLDAKEALILKVLEEKQTIKLSEIANLLEIKSGLKYIKSLHDKGLISIHDHIKEKYSAKIIKVLTLAPEFKNEHFIEELFNQLEKKSPKQVNVLVAMLGEKNVQVPKLDFIKKNNLSKSSVNTLIKNNLLIELAIKKDRVVNQKQKISDIELSKEQHAAVNAIIEGFKFDKPVLLHGNTYSGKSHIFSYIAKQIMDNGKQVLYLLPEVALTEDFHNRLVQYFGDDMISIHSKYNQNEQVELWDKAKSGKAKLIVGPRNATLLPFYDLGLIIVDEEHENSYKQNERSPRFNAKDVSLYLAKKWKCHIILGSATPSIESYYLAKIGKFHLVELMSAYNNKPLAVFETINTAQEKKNGRMKSFISDKLYDHLKESFAVGKKAILFQNRKGYVPITSCNVCEWSQKCINCDITLTYYKYTNNLRCHYCGYHEYPISNCPDCGSSEILTTGAGTEKITEELQLLFPNRKIERFDQESTRGKNKVTKLLHDFKYGDIDALVGTQIIAKGMSFEKVDMAAVVNADQILNFPDFRAHERAFQLFTQLGGRVGNEQEAGTVYIQISQPNHAVIQYVQERNFLSFYHKEITEREQFHYPPFSRLILIQLKHKLPSTVENAAKQLAHFLKTEYEGKILGPESPHIARVRNQYIQQILVKMDRDKDNISAIKNRIRVLTEHLRGMKDYRSVRITFNVDPQ